MTNIFNGIHLEIDCTVEISLCWFSFNKWQPSESYGHFCTGVRSCV